MRSMWDASAAFDTRRTVVLVPQGGRHHQGHVRQDGLVAAGKWHAVERREALVLAVEAAYDRAWSSGDLDALTECLRRDAVLVNPRGQVAVGHAAIRDALGRFLASEAKGSKHRSTVSRITFVRDDVAVVDGDATIELPGGGAAHRHPFTDILVRDHERWVIAHVRAYHFEPPPRWPSQVGSTPIPAAGS